MTTRLMLLLIGGLSVIASPSAQRLQPMFVHSLTGDLRIQQSLPGTCDNVDQTSPVTAGRLEITPADGVDVPGGKSFTLTRADVSFAAFTIERHCMLQDEVREYREVGVQLARAVSFVATPSAAGPGVFDVTIPKDDFRIYEAAIVRSNGGSSQSEHGYKTAKDDVTGTIDFNQRTVQMQVAVATKIHIKFGCAPVLGCVVDDDYNGTLTATLSGTIALPDADGDGVPDRDDNCRFVANADQAPVATPTISGPSPITIASCADHQIGLPTAADRCDGGPVTVTSNAPGTFVVGPNVVTWTAQDAKGRQASSTQNVTVVDTTKPVFTFVPPPIALNDCRPAYLGHPSATDDCAGTPTFKNDAPWWWFPVGPTVVTWTAKDSAGNRSTATQLVTVTDTVDPKVFCAPTDKPKDRDRDRHRDHDHDSDNGYFRVIAIDHCTEPSVRLGGFSLENGEVIKIKETKKPGIRLVHERDSRHVRSFEVGPGQNVIAAQDGSGNTDSARCEVPRDHGRDYHGRR